jgi:ribonuclease HII
MSPLDYDLAVLKAHRIDSLIGVDEVGRGCLAGPVVAAAVTLGDLCDERWRGVTDSKKLTALARERYAELIHKHAKSVTIACCDPGEIDRLNILHASLKAMREALKEHRGLSTVVLVDGHMSPYVGKESSPGEAETLGFTTVQTVVKGDLKSLSIAAASIVAKVYRDRLMTTLDQTYGGYGFAKHKGYPTPLHKEALRKLGPCAIHRRSFCLGTDESWQTV